MSADLRAEFEAWMAKEYPTIPLYHSERPLPSRFYISVQADGMHKAYQAAAHATARRCADIAAIYSASYIVKDIKSEFQEAFGEG